MNLIIKMLRDCVWCLSEVNIDYCNCFHSHLHWSYRVRVSHHLHRKQLQQIELQSRWWILFYLTILQPQIFYNIFCVTLCRNFIIHFFYFARLWYNICYAHYAHILSTHKFFKSPYAIVFHHLMRFIW